MIADDPRRLGRSTGARLRRAAGGAVPTLLRALGVAGALAAVSAPAASAGVFDDTSFDGDGRLLLPETAFARDVAIQPDGKIVLAGSNDSENFAVWRLHPDGQLDRSFSGDGRTIVDIGGGDAGQAVALAPGGKLVVAGTRRAGNTVSDFGVVRLESDGDLDKTFQPGGAQPGVKIIEDDAFSQAADVLVQADGRIVVAGRSGTDYAIARLELDGDLDGTAFELDGMGGLSALNALAIDGAGKIVAGGDAGVARFLDNGALDDTFAGDGTAAAPSDASSVVDLAIEPGGAIVIAGDAGGADPHQYLARMSAKGDLDAGFGDGGTAAPEFFGEEVATGVLRQADGKLLLFGTSREAGIAMTVARYDARGVPDTAYGNGGRMPVPFQFGSATGDAALQPDGRLVLAGVVDVGNNVPQPAVARLLSESPAADPGAGGGPVADTVAPRTTALKVTRKAAGKRGRIAFTLSEPARVQLTLKRRGARVRRFALAGVAGANTTRTPRRLKRGRYRLAVVATDAAGNAGAAVRVRFRIRAGA